MLYLVNKRQTLSTELTIYEEVIFRDILAGLDCSTSVVTQMEDPRFDTKPINILATVDTASSLEHAIEDTERELRIYDWIATIGQQYSSQQR